MLKITKSLFCKAIIIAGITPQTGLAMAYQAIMDHAIVKPVSLFLQEAEKIKADELAESGEHTLLVSYFAQEEELEDVAFVLALNPAIAYKHNEFGFSALHTCITHKCNVCTLKMIPVLAGIVGIDYPTRAAQNLSVKAPYNRTALFIAAQKRNIPVLQALLGLQANPNHLDSQGNTPLDMVLQTTNKIKKERPDLDTKYIYDLYLETVRLLCLYGAKSTKYTGQTHLKKIGISRKAI
jgi:ankyrin repeat protein